MFSNSYYRYLSHSLPNFRSITLIFILMFFHLTGFLFGAADIFACNFSKVFARHTQYITSYTVAFLSPEPVTMYLSSLLMSQLSTEEVSLETKIDAP